MSRIKTLGGHFFSANLLSGILAVGSIIVQISCGMEEDKTQISRELGCDSLEEQECRSPKESTVEVGNIDAANPDIAKDDRSQFLATMSTFDGIVTEEESEEVVEIGKVDPCCSGE